MDREDNITAQEQDSRVGNEVYLYRLNNADILEQVEHHLKGEEWDTKERKWILKYIPWANEEGISKIMSILNSLGLNKNITLGYLTADEIYQRCNIIWKKLAAMLCVNYYKYGVEKSNRSMLIQLVVQQVHSALSRSLTGKEGQQLSSITSRVEHTVLNVKGKKQKENILERGYNYG